MFGAAPILASLLVALRGGEFPAVPPFGGAPSAAPSMQASAPAAPDVTDELFASAPLTLAITIGPEDADRLRREPRGYVRGSLVEGDRSIEVAVKLKGAAGSFRDFDDRPALTVAVDRFVPDQRFRGLARFHLNNSVQDPTLLNEWLAGEILREAGIPATRVTHARVRLNDRDLGVYVLKESFDRSFLARHFADPSGNLYDGGLLQDIDAELELDGGSGAKDRSDLRALIDARAAADRGEGLAPLAERLDIDAFLRFVAVERLLGHWDGYAGSANNYRLYLDPARGGRAVFLPHGLDQLFEDPNASLYGESQTILGSAIDRFDALRVRYRAVVADVAPLLADRERSLARLARGEARLRPAMAGLSDGERQAHDEAVAGLRERLAARAEAIPSLVAEADPTPLGLEPETPRPLDEWFASRDDEERSAAATDEESWSLSIRPPQPPKPGDGEPAEERSDLTAAAWRTSVLLPRGTYELSLACEIRPLRGDREAASATLMTSLGEAVGCELGQSAGQMLRLPIVVREDRRRVDIALELRAVEGSLSMHGAEIRRVQPAMPPLPDTPRPANVSSP